jgi:Tol biopolymer transport system component
MHNCPQPGKWAISVWSGDDGTDIAGAVGTCGLDAVAAAYYLDHQTQGWLRWFDGRPEVSKLQSLDDMQGVLALRSASALPSGESIAFVSDGGERKIYVMNADGSRQINLTVDPADDYDQAWPPDGSRIAFASNRDGNNEVYVMDAEGTDQTNITNSPASGENEPAWSPDGSRIVFQSSRDGNSEIYVMNADGSGQTTLTNDPAWDTQTVWSPEGSQIAFVSDRYGAEQIFEQAAARPGYQVSGLASKPNPLTTDGTNVDPDWYNPRIEINLIMCASEP